MSLNKLTIVIPTKDRTEFVERFLNYYVKTKCIYPFLICDSSNEENLSKNIKLINKYKNLIDIKHIYRENTDNFKASGWQEDILLKNIFEYIKTEYVAFFADDDFAITSNFDKGIDFLENNKNYSFVCGKAYLLSINNKVYGDINWIENYKQGSAEEENIYQRLENYIKNYFVAE